MEWKIWEKLSMRHRKELLRSSKERQLGRRAPGGSGPALDYNHPGPAPGQEIGITYDYNKRTV